MMRMSILPAFLLFIFFAGEGLVVVNQANAVCCMCGTCRSGCTCPGVGACYRCNTPDPSLMQLSLTTNLPGPAVNVRGLQEASSTMLFQSIELAQAGTCSSRHKMYRLNLLDPEGIENQPVVQQSAGQPESAGEYRIPNH